MPEFNRFIRRNTRWKKNGPAKDRCVRAMTLFVQHIERAYTHRTNNNSPVRLIPTPHFVRRMTSRLCTYVQRGICLRANLQLTAQTFRPRAPRPAITWFPSCINIRQKIICFQLCVHSLSYKMMFPVITDIIH